VKGSVSGSITNATKGGTLPPDLPVNLHIRDAQGKETILSAKADASGAFSFADVTMRADWEYVTTTIYRDRLYGSDTVNGTLDSPVMKLALKIYETTSDPTVLSITGVLTQISASAANLQITQIIQVKNNADKAFSSDQPISAGQYGSASLTLPQGATLLGFAETAQRYVVSSDGLTVTDTVPVLPDQESILHVIYQMPYQESGVTFEQRFNYLLVGTAQLLIDPASVTATVNAGSVPLTSLGARTMGTTAYQVYTGDVTLGKGETMRYVVSGSLSGTVTAAGTGGISRDLLVGLLIGGGLGLIVVGGIFLIRDRLAGQGRASGGKRTAQAENPNQAQIDGLIKELAGLDDQYATKKIGKAAYEKRRKELKAQIARLMKG
jgi:hypothetical protein